MSYYPDYSELDVWREILSKMELYAQLGSASSEAVQPSAKVTEVAKPRPRKLEFI